MFFSPTFIALHLETLIPAFAILVVCAKLALSMLIKCISNHAYEPVFLWTFPTLFPWGRDISFPACLLFLF